MRQLIALSIVLLGGGLGWWGFHTLRTDIDPYVRWAGLIGGCIGAAILIVGLMVAVPGDSRFGKRLSFVMSVLSFVFVFGYIIYDVLS